MEKRDGRIKRKYYDEIVEIKTDENRGRSTPSRRRMEIITKYIKGYVKCYGWLRASRRKNTSS